MRCGFNGYSKVVVGRMWTKSTNASASAVWVEWALKGKGTLTPLEAKLECFCVFGKLKVLILDCWHVGLEYSRDNYDGVSH